jgi:mercuric ion binding protein
MIEPEQKATGTGKGLVRRGMAVAVAVCALAAASALCFAVRVQMKAGVAAVIAPAVTERVVVAVEGMHCGGCASGIKAMLKRTDGVVSADVSYERKEAVVEFDPGRTSREKIVEAINNMGYKVSVKG